MGLESVNFISDLNASNPASGDKKNEGDDHIRNIKKALVQSFPGITRPIYSPLSYVFNATTELTLGHDNASIFVNTGDLGSGLAGKIFITLPNTAGTASFSVNISKSDTGTGYVQVQTQNGAFFPSGVTYVNIHPIGHVIRFVWVGTTWVYVRPGEPAGTPIPFAGASPPRGYRICNGNTEDRLINLELFGALGYSWGGSGDAFGIPDLRERSLVGAGSQSVGVLTGTGSMTLTTSHLPAHNHIVDVGVSPNPHSHVVNNGAAVFAQIPGPNSFSGPGVSANTVNLTTGGENLTVTASTRDVGSGSSFSLYHPVGVVHYILRRG